MVKHIFSFLAALAALAVSAADATHADILKQIPDDVLACVGGAIPDAQGFVGHNRGGFKGSAFQRGATLTLAFAAARGDKARANECWRAVDAAFAQQKEEGHFGDPPTSVAFWLCELCRTLLVVQESPLAQDFKARLDELQPKVRKAATWLAGQQAALVKADGDTPNRLFFSAEAFGFAGLFLKDEKLVEIGKEFLKRGLKLYRESDGVFLEHGGGDSSYQAVNLLRLQELVLRFPDPALDAAIQKGMTWELAHIDASGAVGTEGNTRVRPGGEKFMGAEKSVNVGEVVLALLYCHGRRQDAESLAVARRVCGHYRKK